MIIAIDFDDTITESSPYPIMGKIKEQAVVVIKKLKSQGHTICLWTCRAGEYLDEAIKALKEKGIEFDYINNSPIDTGSRKIVADIYIDDRAYGGEIDWEAIEKNLLPLT